MTDDASAEFETLVKAFQENVESVRQRIEDIKQLTSLEEVNATLVCIEELFQLAREQVRKMEFSHRQLSPSDRATFSPTLRLCQRDVTQLKRDVVRSRDTAGRRDLLERQNEVLQGKREQLNQQQRGRLLHAFHVQSDTNTKLDSTRSSLKRSQEAGATVVGELRRQRESLERSVEHVKETNDNLDRVKNVLRAMARRTVTNKLITAFVIFILLAIIALIVYFKFYKGHRFPFN